MLRRFYLHVDGTGIMRHQLASRSFPTLKGIIPIIWRLAFTSGVTLHGCTTLHNSEEDQPTLCDITLDAVCSACPISCFAFLAVALAASFKPLVMLRIILLTFLQGRCQLSLL